MEESPVKMDGSGGLQAERRTRRRLVQSTLFPCKKAADEPGEDGGGTLEEPVEDEEDGEVCPESGCKDKKRKRKPQSRTPKKASAMNKRSPGQSTKARDCVVPAKADFFLTASEKKLQQMQQRKQDGVVDLTTMDNNENSKTIQCVTGKGSCGQLNEKTNKSSKVAKGITNGMVGLLWREENSIEPEGHQMEETKFGLRLEAKIAVEEDACLLAGKQLHPFFSWWKAKKSHEIVEINDEEADCCASVLCDSPLHVYEKVEDERISLDWKNWVFSERNIFDVNSSYPPDTSCSSAFEGSVKPLNFDTITSVGGICSDLSPEIYLDHLHNKGEDTNGVPHQLSIIKKMVSQEEEIGPETYKKDERQTNKEWKASYGKPKNYCLWTDKYQPEKAFEVCGNSESVRSLSDWLQSWHEKVPQTSRSSTQTSACSWSEYDSDMEDMDEESTLKNVFLVTGPVGSGKSAAIYACAKEQGFEVIEVSASDCRNGAHVKQKFGGAVESHRFNGWWQSNLESSETAQNLELSSSQPDSVIIQELDDDLCEVSTTSKKEPQPMIGISKQTVGKRATNKTLILFEDVDTVFDEDRGFIGTIMQLAETAKRPMILTSNRRDPSLPQLLDRLVVDFTLPSVEELLSSVHMVCAAEKAIASPKLLERFVRSCQVDIRKTINLLQFWFQGSRDEHAQGFSSLCTSLQYDINAWHLVLPIILPWGFPCELSKFVEKEISEVLSIMWQEKLSLDGVLISSQFDHNEDDEIKARKKAMLRKNFSLQEYTEVPSQYDKICDFSDSASGSPVMFSRRTIRHKSNAILSSGSEDDELPAMSHVPSEAPMIYLRPGIFKQENGERTGTAEHLGLLTDQNGYMGKDDTLFNSFSVDTTRKFGDICGSPDISCVPESSFVPETENNDPEEIVSRTVSSDHCPVALNDDASTYNLPMKVGHLDELALEHKKLVMEAEKSGQLNMECLDAEEQGDSQIKDAEAMTKVCTLMDECSRVDFSSGSILLENAGKPADADLVQAMWRTLRNRGDLKSHVTPEQQVASHILEVADGLTNLISEADIMFNCCQPIISDHLEPSLVPCNEPDAMRWYDEQVEMGSTFALHGFCLYVKRASEVGQKLGSQRKVDIAREMLACSTSATALGKQVMHEQDVSSSSLQDEAPVVDISFIRKHEGILYNTILPISPPRFQLALRGALHDYLSFLSHITRSENLRLSTSIDGKRKRCRARTARHYLSSGPLALSPDDVHLLAQYGWFKLSGP